MVPDGDTTSESANMYTGVVHRYTCISAKVPKMDGNAASHSSFSSCLAGEWKIGCQRVHFSLSLIYMIK